VKANFSFSEEVAFKSGRHEIALTLMDGLTGLSSVARYLTDVLVSSSGAPFSSQTGQSEQNPDLPTQAAAAAFSIGLIGVAGSAYIFRRRISQAVSPALAQLTATGRFVTGIKRYVGSVRVLGHGIKRLLGITQATHVSEQVVARQNVRRLIGVERAVVPVPSIAQPQRDAAAARSSSRGRSSFGSATWGVAYADDGTAPKKGELLDGIWGAITGWFGSHHEGSVYTDHPLASLSTAGSAAKDMGTTAMEISLAGFGLAAIVGATGAVPAAAVIAIASGAIGLFGFITYLGGFVLKTLGDALQMQACRDELCAEEGWNRYEQNFVEGGIVIATLGVAKLLATIVGPLLTRWLAGSKSGANILRTFGMRQGKINAIKGRTWEHGYESAKGLRSVGNVKRMNVKVSYDGKVSEVDKIVEGFDGKVKWVEQKNINWNNPHTAARALDQLAKLQAISETPRPKGRGVDIY